MKIVHVIECFAGGTLEFLVQLINHMSQCQHMIIYGKRDTTPFNYRELFPSNTKFVLWKNIGREIRMTKDISAYLELVAILRQEIGKDSVLHLHSSKAGFLGRVAAMFLGMDARVVYTVHGLSYLRTDVGKLKMYLYILLEKIASFNRGTIVACSDSEKQSFLKYGIKNNLHQINNGISIGEFLQKKLTNSIVIGTVGRISEQKNPALFNEIAKKYESRKDIKFIWIGDGELRGKLTARNIYITGWLDKSNVEKRLFDVDIYISTALWEGLPFAVLEAMRMKKALLLSNCVGNKDLVDIGGNGYLFEDAKEARQRIEEFIEDKEKIKSCGINSYIKVKNENSVQKMVSEYFVLYKNILNKKGKYV